MRRVLIIIFTLGLALVALQSIEFGAEPQEKQELPSGPSILMGRIVDANGSPVANAEVLAASHDPNFAWPLDAPALTDEGATYSRAVTESDGRFRFETLNAGPAQLSIRAADSALRDLRGITLTPGSETDLGDVRLQAGARVRGTLLSHARQAIAGATVFFMRPESSLPHAHPWTGVPVARTDASGSFEITQLEPGPFTLAFDATGEAPFRIRGHVLDELDLGELELPESSAISGIVRCFPLGELSDMRVVALPTLAVPFAKRPNGERGVPARWLDGYRTASIGEYGGFVLTDLEPNRYYSLRVLALGDELRVPDSWSPPKLVPSGSEDIVLTVHPSVRMDFRVIDARTGDPVTEFQHEWIGARNLPRNGVDYLRATGDSRRVHLEVRAPGFDVYRSEPLALVAANSLTPLRVELMHGASPLATPKPASAPQPRVSRLDSLPGFASARNENTKREEPGHEMLTGHITVRGLPLAGAVLRVFPLRDRDEFFEARDDALQTGRTDRDGRFKIPNLPQGEHLIAIEHESRAQLTLRVIAAGDVSFELEDLELHGRVVAADGSPVANARIHLPQHWKREARFASADGDGDQSVIAWKELQTPPQVAITDASGRFTLTGLEAGDPLTLGARSKRLGVGTLRLANLDQEATILLSSNSALTVDGVDAKPLERALGVAWRWGRDYGHEVRFSYGSPLNTQFRGLSADEWTVFQVDINGWAELSSLRILAPVLLDPVGDSRIRVQH